MLNAVLGTLKVELEMMRLWDVSKKLSSLTQQIFSRVRKAISRVLLSVFHVNDGEDSSRYQ